MVRPRQLGWPARASKPSLQDNASRRPVFDRVKPPDRWPLVFPPRAGEPSDAGFDPRADGRVENSESLGNRIRQWLLPIALGFLRSVAGTNAVPEFFGIRCGRSAPPQKRSICGDNPLAARYHHGIFFRVRLRMEIATALAYYGDTSYAQACRQHRSKLRRSSAKRSGGAASAGHEFDENDVQANSITLHQKRGKLRLATAYCGR